MGKRSKSSWKRLHYVKVSYSFSSKILNSIYFDLLNIYSMHPHSI